MKIILHVSGNIFSSTINISDHTFKIWNELSTEFDEYHILARADDNKFHFTKYNNIFLHLVPKLSQSSSSFMLSSFYSFVLIYKYHINLVLLQSSIVGAPALVLAKKLFHFKILTEIHGDDYFYRFEHNFLFRLIRNWTFRNSYKIRSLSPKMTLELNKIGFFDNIFEVYNRVDLKLFFPPKNDFAINNIVNIVSVGRFCNAKNYEFILNNLNCFNFDFHLTLIGGGPNRSNYVNILSNSIHESQVTLIDWVDQRQLVDILRNADIYIQSSISEGVPRTTIEAMGMKLPIVSTNVGLIDGILLDGYNSLLSKPNSLDFFTCINKLVVDKSLRSYLAGNAYHDALTKFEWNIAFKSYKDFLRV